MSILEWSADAVKIEIYKRAVRLYKNAVCPWIDCLAAALTSVQLEMDVWLMAPTEA